MTNRGFNFTILMPILIIAFLLYGAEGILQNGYAQSKADITWSELRVEPGQMVSASFRGLTVKPEDLRFWIDGNPIKIRFDVVQTGGNANTLEDDLVVAQQFIPIIEPGEYKISLGTQEKETSEPQILTILPTIPKHEKELVAEVLAVGLRLIARDIAAVSRSGNAGFHYYQEQAINPSATESLHSELSNFIESAPHSIRKEYTALSKEHEAGIQAMLVNMQILPALEQLFGREKIEHGSSLDPHTKYLLYVEMNSLVLHEFGERFSLLQSAINRLNEKDGILQFYSKGILVREMPLERTLEDISPLWEVLKKTKIDLLSYLEKNGPESDGDDPRDTPRPMIYGEEINGEDSCRVKVQCHWALARGPRTGWLSKILLRQRHCAFYTRINAAPQPMLGHHIKSSPFTAQIETLPFSSDAGFYEKQSDYWDLWDSYKVPANSCALAQCLRNKSSEYDIFTERPYKAFTDGQKYTTSVHSNSSSFIGAMVESCSIPSPKPGFGNISTTPLIRMDYTEGFVGWHYWQRAEPPVEFWKQVSSAKTPPTIHPYSPKWLIELHFKLWWYL